jgi:hypothetical protein
MHLLAVALESELPESLPYPSPGEQYFQCCEE